MDAKVGELEINNIFNRKESEIISSVPEIASDKKEENPNITTVSEPQQLLTTVTDKLQDDPNLLKRSISPTGSDKSNDRPSTKIKPDGKNLSEGKSVEPVVARDSEKLADIPLKKSNDRPSKKIKPDGKNLPEEKRVEPVVARDSDIPLEKSNDRPTKKIKPNGKNLPEEKEPVVARDSEKLTDIPLKKSNDRPSKKIKPDGKTIPEEKLVEPVVARDSKKLTDIPLKKSKVENSNKVPVNAINLNGVGTFGTKSDKGKIDIANKDSMKMSIVPEDKLENRERNKTPSGSDKLQNVPFKKRKFDFKTPLMETEVEPKDMSAKKSIVDNKSKHEDKLSTDVGNLKALGTSGSTEEKLNQRNGKVSLKVTDALEGKIIKKTKDDCSQELPDNRRVGNNTNGSSGEDLVASSALSKGKSKCVLGLDSVRNNKKHKGEQSDENKKKLAVNKLLKGSALSNDRDKKIPYQEFVCDPKPNADKSGWFRQLPWDQRLKNAYDQGTAVLLHNVDTDFTSADIEDIVWNAFNENCEAKIVQRTAVSSPHHDQALILLNTKEAAQRILARLDEECLIVSSNGRPLVATVCPPISTKKDSSFFGHLVLDKNRVQSQREDEAVSTSHFSQPNTIEYDMAMDWCLLQSWSKNWWDKIHKQQGLELKKLESTRVQK
ncbi:bromo adjacent homology (BAH) domain protein [Artemisia annua]|uniref:Bromo adjacent homology (BAH) domain protein n=1 Tax=Artemisia annua TaxID=35608 RepID=A0A2U1MJS7_ARTAN|nr:bromo adjacent homology (BAH) domain protein [Artemisia annua]